jgi:hypothetical protein
MPITGDGLLWNPFSSGWGIAEDAILAAKSAFFAYSFDSMSRLTVSALRQQMCGVWYDARIEWQRLEEALDVHKDVNSVMEAQSELTQVIQPL